VKKFLIIAYTFPPTPGVGGRRWAKFAKYLHRKGYDVRVIAAKVPYEQESHWSADIEALADEGRITYVQSGYPKYMYSPKTFFEKVMYRVSLAYLKLRVKGQYYDPSVLWKKHLIPVVEEHIEEGYKTIVATGAPFRYLTDLGALKNNHSDIKLIADIRDPWTTNKTSYGYDSLSPERLNFEKKSEQSLVQNFDHIITVYRETTVYFEKLNLTTKCIFSTIRNGFDYDDMRLSDLEGKIETEKLKFVFVGTFYQKALHNLNEFMKALDTIKSSHQTIYERLQFDFYGDVPKQFNKIIKPHQNIIKFHGKIPLNKVADTIYNSSGAMLFLTDDMNYSFSTKFYEYISLKRVLLIVSKEGTTGEFVEKNNLGFMISQGNMYNQLLFAIHKISDGYQVNESFDLTQYSVEHLTDELIDVLDEHRKGKNL